MKRLLIVFALGLTTAGRLAWAIPNEINYQGTLREKSLPANGDKNITFTLTSADGQTPYSQSITVKTPVKNGLFSVKLNFQLLSGNTWENITPYIKVNVDGQDLAPTEKVSATVYALVSNSVIDGVISTPKLADGSVTTAKVADGTVTTSKLGIGSVTTVKISDGNVTRSKLDTTSFEPAGAGLVPQGAIMLFGGNCPNGWSHYAALDGVFPMGGSTAGAVGGQSQHSHSTPDHSHVLALNSQISGNPGSPIGVTHNSGSSGLIAYNAGASVTADIMQNYTQVSGGGTTSQANNIPPYRQMVFCQKI